MNRQIYVLNEDGFIRDIQIAEFDELGQSVEPLQEGTIAIDPPNGLYRARWTGTDWVEDMSDEDITKLKNTVPVLTTEEKLTNILAEYTSLRGRVDDTEVIIMELILA